MRYVVKIGRPPREVVGLACLSVVYHLNVLLLVMSDSLTCGGLFIMVFSLDHN